MEGRVGGLGEEKMRSGRSCSRYQISQRAKLKGKCKRDAYARAALARSDSQLRTGSSACHQLCIFSLSYSVHLLSAVYNSIDLLLRVFLFFFLQFFAL